MESQHDHNNINSECQDHLSKGNHVDNERKNSCCPCCGDDGPNSVFQKPPSLDPKLLEKKLSEREEQLRLEFAEKLLKESEALIERFNVILQNEQVRSSFMLREAHREKQEKIMALRQQLECKNLAALMYVMCSERTKSKLEKLQIIETFTNYINMLNHILADGQELILNLSRGYKTAARVDFEWKEKMTKVVGEFQQFIYHFTGHPPEQNQYFFDLPKLLKTAAPIEDNPLEDPIEEEESTESSLDYPLEEHKTWWEKLDDDCRPFVMFGDMSEFKPPERRETLKLVKAAKTAPKKWKEYAFHDMFLQSKCPNADQIKNEYFDRLPDPQEWDCEAWADLEKREDNKNPYSRVTTASVDIRGNMGSILKIITANGLSEPVTKANLLGARDSMEIASTTRLRVSREKSKSYETGMGSQKVEIKVGTRRTSFFSDKVRIHEHEGYTESVKSMVPTESKTQEEVDDNKISMPSLGALGRGHTDSLDMVSHHVPDRDSKIKYDRNCPIKRCQGLRINSFTRGLPKYMKEEPFTQFRTTFDNYETCTPEQIEELKRRIEEKKMKMRSRKSLIVEPLIDWQESVEGIGVQTSNLSYLHDNMPPCTCRDDKRSISSSDPGAVYKMDDLIPLKENMDEVKKECLWDNNIQFNRFKVVGRESSDSIRARNNLDYLQSNWTRNRVQEIGKILKQHPSLLDIFQANTRC